MRLSLDTVPKNGGCHRWWTSCCSDHQLPLWWTRVHEDERLYVRCGCLQQPGDIGNLLFLFTLDTADLNTNSDLFHLQRLNHDSTIVGWICKRREQESSWVSWCAVSKTICYSTQKRTRNLRLTTIDPTEQLWTSRPLTIGYWTYLCSGFDV